MDKLQTVFDSFAKLTGKDDGKISSDTIQKWIKKAGIDEISGDTIKKHFSKVGGWNFDDFKQGIEKLAKDSNQGKDEIMKKLSSVVPSKEDIAEGIKSKLGF